MSSWKEREVGVRQERTCLWQDSTVRLMRRAKGGGQRIAVTHWESPIRRRQVNILSSQVWERERMSLIFENRQYGLGEWQEKEMDGEITRLRHQRRASGWKRWNKTHFQGTFMHLFFPLYSFKMGKMTRSNISFFPDRCICTHIKSLLIQAHQPWPRRESDIQGCAEKREDELEMNVEGAASTNITTE